MANEEPTMNEELAMNEEPMIAGTVTSLDDRHPTTRVDGFCKHADIDVEIAPLIEKLWQLKISTNNSCQDWAGRPGCVWISFDNVDDLNRFVLRAISLHHNHSSFVGRVTQNSLYPPDDEKADDWRYRLFVEDTSYYNRPSQPGVLYSMPDDYDYGSRAIASHVQVSFPRKDLLAVCQAFGVDVGYDTDWKHDLCGREYTDATRDEIALWTSRVASTGFCCGGCRAEHEDEDDDD